MLIDYLFRRGIQRSVQKKNLVSKKPRSRLLKNSNKRQLGNVRLNPKEWNVKEQFWS